MNLVITLTLPIWQQKRPPATSRINTHRLYCIALQGDQREFLQALLDTEIDKHRFNLTDQFCSSPFRIRELMVMDSLVPHLDANVVLTGVELGYVQAYVDQKIMQIVRYQASPVAGICPAQLVAALRRLRHALLNRLEIKPLSTLRSC